MAVRTNRRLRELNNEPRSISAEHTIVCSGKALLEWNPAQWSAYGAIAQLGERIVRNDEVVGSIPTSSTINQKKKVTGW